MDTLSVAQPSISILDTAVFAEERTYQKAYQWVDDERKKKIDNCRLTKDKYLSLGAGVLLKKGLEEKGISLYSLMYGEHGKPYLANNPNVFFSLSHSGTLVACAFHNKEIGVDIQKTKAVSENLIKRVSTKAEYDYLMSCEEEKRNHLFFRLWTAKESYMKYLGTGLSLSTKKLEVTFGDTLTIKHDGKAVAVVLEEKMIEGYTLTFCYKK